MKETLSLPQAQDKKLLGHVCLVTGGNRGIGKAIALALAESGTAVAIGARTQESLEVMKLEFEARRVPYLVQKLDVRDEGSVNEFFARTNKELGPVDILVNNAGIYKTEPMNLHCLSTWEDIIKTNLTGAFLTCRLSIQNMMDRKWGRIINIASVSGKVGEIYGGAYSASKFGLIGLTQSLALEVAKYDITVNAICPGWVNTDMATKQLTDDKWLALNSLSKDESMDIACLSVPIGRLIEPQEVASLVVYLCSEQAKGITGQAINVCGGLALH